MNMPSDEYLRNLQDKLFNIEQEVGNLQADIGLYLSSARNHEDIDHLIKSLRDVQEEITGSWPKDPNAPKVQFEKIERPFIRRLSASEIIQKPGGAMHSTEEIRYNCGPHAVLIRPGSIDGPPPFKVTVWLNADKGNTSHNKEFVEIKSEREFKTREAAYEYGSHLCRRTNERSAD